MSDMQGALADSSKTNGYGANHVSAVSDQVAAVAFDATISSGLYGASATVQPTSVRLLACIKA